MTDFDPSKYLTKVGSADYLEVKWRLVWLRQEHPDADIDTQLMSPPDTGEAIFKARITIPGGGSATGWGSETPNDFRDYLEKAETKAIGRALSALGYGTQFAPDHDFGGERGKVVDSPVKASRAIAYVDPTPRSNRASIDAATQQSTLTDVEPDITSWGSLWTAIRAAPYHLMTAEDVTELVQRSPDQFKSPQHAFNAIKKAIRERDAAIAANREGVTTAK